MTPLEILQRDYPLRPDWADCEAPSIPKGWMRILEPRFGDCFWNGDGWVPLMGNYRLKFLWPRKELGEVFIRPLDLARPILDWLRRREGFRRHIEGMNQNQLLREYRRALGTGDGYIAEAFLNELRRRRLIA